MRRGLHAIVAAMALVTIGISGGCASYTTPGRGADLAQVGATEQARKNLTDPSLRETLEQKPLAAFPTGIAVVRIQAPSYSSPTTSGWGSGGQYSVILTRDVEKDEHYARLAKLPLVSGIAPMSRLLLPTSLKDDLPLRQAAAKLHADMLLIYTFDTTFSKNQMAQPLSVVTLGLSPTKTIKVTTTASAILMDTRNGYLYGLAEGTATRSKLTNVWMTSDAIDDARRKNEEEAFEKLVGEFEKTWAGVVTQYAAHPAAGSTPAGAKNVTVK